MAGHREVGDLPVADFDRWVEPHLPVLAAIAVREVGAATSDDVVQETLLRAWQRHETFDATRGSARAWLVAILLDRCRRHRVRSLRPATRLDTDHAPPGTSPPTDSSDRLDVEAAVRALPERQRQLVTLHYLADLPVAEVATLLHLSPGAVKAQLFEARANLRRIWGDRS